MLIFSRGDCAGGENVQRFRDAEVQRCTCVVCRCMTGAGAEQVQRCRGAEVLRCGTEVTPGTRGEPLAYVRGAVVVQHRCILDAEVWI